jgi:hypothetical protein
MKYSLAACLLLSYAAAFAPVLRTPSRLGRLSVSDGSFDFDVAIIGCGVGGHGAALHSRAQDLKTAVFAGNDVGGVSPCFLPERGCSEMQ